MHTLNDMVALVRKIDRHPPAPGGAPCFELPSGPGSRLRRFAHEMGDACSRPALGLASLVALTAGCASAFEPRGTSALSAAEAGYGEWLGGEPPEGEPLTPRGAIPEADRSELRGVPGGRPVPWWREDQAAASADEGWFETDGSAPEQAAPEGAAGSHGSAAEAAGSGRAPAGGRGRASEGAADGPASHESIYYLRGVGRPVGSGSHAWTGREAQQAYPTYSGYDGPVR